MNLDKITAFAKHRREELMLDALDPEDDVFPPILIFGRQGKTVATVFVEGCNAKPTMEALTVGIRGYGADEVVMVVDGHSLVGEDAREQFQDLEPNELQNECIENCGKHREGVSDVLVVNHAIKGGDVFSYPHTYDPNYEENTITWTNKLAHEKDDVKTLSSEDLGDGYQNAAPDVFRRLFSMKRLEDEITFIDDPVSQMIRGMIEKFAGPDGDRRKYLDQAISTVLEKEGDCKVITPSAENTDE